MSDIIDFSALRLHRQKILIAVAGSVHATFYPTGGAPIVPAFDLIGLLDELKRGPGWPEADYRTTVFWLAAKHGGQTPADFDPEPHHAAAAQWARELLAQTQPNLITRIFSGGRQ